MDKIKTYEALLNRTLDSLRVATYYDHVNRCEANKLYDDIKKALSEPVIDSGWISVKDRLPEYDKTVLVVNEDGYMHTAVRIKGSIARIDEWQIKFGVYFIDNDVWEEDEQGKITHWQYLPEPPKGGIMNERQMV